MYAFYKNIQSNLVNESQNLGTYEIEIHILG